MRHRRTGRKLGRDGAHRDAMKMNMAGALIRHGRIRTTETKAKELRPFVERLVTRARVDNLQNRRIVRKTLRMHDTASSRKAGEKTIVQTLFRGRRTSLRRPPRWLHAHRQAGLAPGDAAPMAFIEWVDYVPEARGWADDSAAHAHSHDFATQAEAEAHSHA